MNQYSKNYWDNQAEIIPAEEIQIIVGSADCKGVVIRKSADEKQEDLLNEGTQSKPASIESSSAKKKNGKKKMAVLGAAYTIDPNYRTPEEVLCRCYR